MTNPSTAAQTTASTAVDEAVRIASDSSRRTTESAQAAFAFGRRFLDQSTVTNRDLLTLWTNSAEASFQTAFEMQNAALTSSQSLFETSYTLSKDALRRWADITRQAQSTAVKAYQANTRLFTAD